MSWRLRNQGSPQPMVGTLTTEQLVDGLRDEVYTGLDEIKGPGDEDWTQIAEHPHFEELVGQLENEAAAAATPAHSSEDDHIDMNPLIDVCLVLLVFFILATTMAVLEKVIDVPQNRRQGPRTVSQEEVAQTMVIVNTFRKDGKTHIMLEGRDVPMDRLSIDLGRYTVAGSPRRELVIDAAPNGVEGQTMVDWATIAGIIDAAAQAQINRVHFKASPEATKQAGQGMAPPAGGAAPAK